MKCHGVMYRNESEMKQLYEIYFQYGVNVNILVKKMA